MTRPITIQSAKYPFLLDHSTQSRHHRSRGFFLDQLRIVDFAGGIIQDHNPVVPAIVIQPSVCAAIDVQQHPRQGSSLSPPAMRPAPLSPLHQPRSLQGLLDPRVAQLDRVLFLQLFV